MIGAFSVAPARLAVAAAAQEASGKRVQPLPLSCSPFRPHHGATQLVQPGPCGLIGTKTEGILQTPAPSTPFFWEVTNQIAANQVDNGVCER